MPREVGLTFTDEMVRAILNGRKWQTRRPLAIKPPRAEAGDVVWVREAWADLRGQGFGPNPATGREHTAAYRERTPPGSRGDEVRQEYGVKWKPSIHMPRWAARIFLLLVSVREERVDKITEEDAEAEGVEGVLVPPDGGSAPMTESFHQMWQSIYGSRFPWEKKPMVRVYEWEPQKVEVRE